jgi:hypothetical protein
VKQGREGRAQALEDELHRQGGHDQAHEPGEQAVHDDEPRDQASDEKVPMSTRETMSQDENRLAKEG